ncbi:MAG: hypothetical protein R6X33_12030 [Candidatus Brocadiia bacterium]
MLKGGEPYRYAPERTTREKLGRMRYHATGVPRKGGVAKGTPRSAAYGTGVRSRTLRAKEDKERLQSAQCLLRAFIEERTKKPRPPAESS